MTTFTRETTTRAWIYDVRMAQFVLKIEKMSHIMGPRESQDLRSPSPIMAPDPSPNRQRASERRVNKSDISFESL